jgi:sarcosine oxidase subunit gamma
MKLQLRTAFAGVRCNCEHGAGVVAIERSGLALARVQASNAGLPQLYEKVRNQLGLELPTGSLRQEAGGLALIGVGTASWLAVAERDPQELVDALRDSLREGAAVSDQSGAYGVLRLSGPRVRDTLRKLVAIDIHPKEFPPGAAAVTIATHIPLMLWRLPDGTDGPMFELAVPRSYCGSFAEALTQSAAEFGFVLEV